MWNLIGRAGVSPPSRTAAIIFLYIYLYPCRTSCPKCYTRFFFSDISIFPNLCMPCAMDLFIMCPFYYVSFSLCVLFIMFNLYCVFFIMCPCDGLTS